ncbi:MAG: hypothetical protein B6D59_05655 [Campylobacteraceae bacterium 4484_4]|nr:MAG: hypothetical protein B6D59_05655 [Campylobacteraceae bacterium 4484_4]
MKSAMITGASSGIGLACAKRLCEMGYRIFAIARDFQKCGFSHPSFIPIPCDLRSKEALFSLKKRIDKNDLEVIIHAAGKGYFAPHESLKAAWIEEMITLNLTAPMLLDRLFLRDLKQKSGHLFYIGSISGIEAAPTGAVYGATKAALAHYAGSLFKEARKSGLRVTTIAPDITDTPFFDDLHFAPTEDPLTYIESEDIAELVATALQLRKGSVVTQITLQPQFFRLKKRKTDRKSKT